MKIRKISQSAGVVADVVDSLNSDSSINALSAAAGKELNKKIDNLNISEAIDTAISTVVSKTATYITTDLNNVKETGFYYVSGADINSPKNNFSWFLTVIKFNNNYILQTATRADAYDPITYERQLRSGSWTGWRQANFGYMGEIVAGTDFNDFTTNGIYQYGGTVCTNQPPNFGIVEVMRTGAYIIQRCSNANSIAQRVSYDSGAIWQGWVKVTLTAES